MAPEVSGEDITEGDSGCPEAEAWKDGGPCKAKAATAGGASSGAKSLADRQRTRSLPSAAAAAWPLCRDGTDREEQLRLLWSLWEAQQNLLEEEEVIREALAAHSELSSRNDFVHQEVLDVEAELHECALRDEAEGGRPRHGPHRQSLQSNSSEERAACGKPDLEDLELEDLQAQNEALLHNLHRIAEVRAQSLTTAQPPERTPVRGSGRDVEALEAELLHLRRTEERRAEEHHSRLEDLQDQIREAKARSQERRWQLHEELAEAYAENEVLESEIHGAIRGRELTLQRLQREEQVLLHEVQEAAEEHRTLVEARATALEELLAGSGARECCDAEDRLSEVSTRLGSDAMVYSTHASGISIWEELRRSANGSSGGAAAPDPSAQPWGPLALQGGGAEGQAVEGRGSDGRASAGARRRLRRTPTLVGYRCSQAPRPCSRDSTGSSAFEALSGPEDEAVEFLGPASRLSIIGEAAAEGRPIRYPWEKVKERLPEPPSTEPDACRHGCGDAHPGASMQTLREALLSGRAETGRHRPLSGATASAATVEARAEVAPLKAEARGRHGAARASTQPPVGGRRESGFGGCIGCSGGAMDRHGDAGRPKRRSSARDVLEWTVRQVEDSWAWRQ
uniref:Uncharacterized protein n=1 Tax=Pyrodinium bahamense TaxID=73915 RepID=A0A7S0B6U1_9DINO|mmetsp:Transcript_52148/g.144373  ORF Transcript_52148/g.144373 Transcript_52148/m.144373 type:complete len:625 (+) Transcript_52148:117-1991(+)